MVLLDIFCAGSNDKMKHWSKHVARGGGGGWGRLTHLRGKEVYSAVFLF